MTLMRRDMISASVFGIGALWFFVHVSGYPVRQGQPPAVSAGYYPRILAMLLGVLAIIQFAGALTREIRHRKTNDDAAPELMPRAWKDRRTFGLFMITLAALLVYPFLMNIIGFSITGFLFVGTLIVALSHGELRRGKYLLGILLATLGIAVFTYLVFRHFLEIPFPRGVFFRR